MFRGRTPGPDGEIENRGDDPDRNGSEDIQRSTHGGEICERTVDGGDAENPVGGERDGQSKDRARADDREDRSTTNGANQQRDIGSSHGIVRVAVEIGSSGRPVRWPARCRHRRPEQSMLAAARDGARGEQEMARSSGLGEQPGGEIGSQASRRTGAAARDIGLLHDAANVAMVGERVKRDGDREGQQAPQRARGERARRPDAGPVQPVE